MRPYVAAIALALLWMTSATAGWAQVPPVVQAKAVTREEVLRLRGQGKTDLALEQALVLLDFKSRQDSGSLTTARLQRDVGDLLMDSGKPKEAVAHYERCCQIIEARVGKTSQFLDPTLTRLGRAYLQLHEPARAMTCFRRALDLRLAVLPADNPESLETIRLVCQCLNQLHDEQGLSKFLRELRSRAEFESSVRRDTFLQNLAQWSFGTIAGHEVMLDILHSDAKSTRLGIRTIDAVLRFVNAAAEQHNYNEALSLLSMLTKRVEICDATDRVHWLIYTAHESAEINVIKRDYAAAVPFFNRELELIKLHPEESPIVPRPILLCKLGVALGHSNKMEEAGAVLKQALSEADREFPRSEVALEQSLTCLASWYLSNRHGERAEPLLRRKVILDRKYRGELSTEHLEALERLAACLYSLKRKQDLSVVLKQCLSIRRQMGSRVAPMSPARYRGYQSEVALCGDAALADMLKGLAVAREPK